MKITRLIRTASRGIVSFVDNKMKMHTIEFDAKLSDKEVEALVDKTLSKINQKQKVQPKQKAPTDEVPPPEE